MTMPASPAFSSSSSSRLPFQKVTKNLDSPNGASRTNALSWRVATAKASVEPERPVAPVPVPEETRSREELLKDFHREIAQTIRQLGDGFAVSAAVSRLREHPLPPGCFLDETVDLIARMVDEPRARRQQLFPLLLALYQEGLFSPHGVLGEAVEAFTHDAFADPGDVDPPELADIVLRELLPAVRLTPSALHLPPCLSEIQTAEKLNGCDPNHATPSLPNSLSNPALPVTQVN